MVMKVIYDLSFNGFMYKTIEAGIYRVCDEIFKRMVKKKDLELFYSVFGYANYPITNENVENYLIGNNYPLIPKANERKFRQLPFKKEKLFKYLYKKYKIYDYSTSPMKNILDSADIYYSVFYPIPKYIQNKNHIKKVITIHDTTPFIFNNSDVSLMSDILNSIDDSTTIITVSEHTKRDILHYAPHIKTENIYVCPLAASEEFFYPCKDSEKFEKIKEKYQLPDKYFLSLSTLEPRKNIDHLIRCFLKTIRENKFDDLYLVLAGKKGWLFDKIFEEHDNAGDLKDRIIFTGFVPNEDLASIYSNAQAFYYMTLYEGFGLPPLEAMQCGTPVVVSDNSSLPEVVGDAGILIDAKDEEKLIQAMINLYNNGDLRKSLSEKSLIQAQKFSWDKVADSYLQIWRKIIQQ